MEGIESGAVSIVVCGRYDAWRRAYTWFSVQSNQPFKIKENLFETIQVVCAAAHFFSRFFSLCLPFIKWINYSFSIYAIVPPKFDLPFRVKCNISWTFGIMSGEQEKQRDHSHSNV